MAQSTPIVEQWQSKADKINKICDAIAFTLECMDEVVQHMEMIENVEIPLCHAQRIADHCFCLHMKTDKISKLSGNKLRESDPAMKKEYEEQQGKQWGNVTCNII